MKICTRCGESKPLTDFYQHPKMRDGRYNQCIVCRREYIDGWNRANRDWIRERERARRETPEYKARKNELNQRAQANRRKRMGDAEYKAAHNRKAMVGRLKATHGLTVEDIEKLLAEQGHACAICRAPMTLTGNRNVDHDHETGRIRGLLCGRCNTGLGNFRDQPALIESAMAYLGLEHALPCSICGCSLDGVPKHRRHVDHDHATGRLRGVLCELCNRAIGQFDDDIDRMRAAVAYLRRGESEPV